MKFTLTLLLSILFAVTTLAQSSSDQDFLLYYPFNGNALDKSGNNINSPVIGTKM